MIGEQLQLERQESIETAQTPPEQELVKSEAPKAKRRKARSLVILYSTLAFRPGRLHLCNVCMPQHNQREAYYTPQSGQLHRQRSNMRDCS